MAPRTPDEPAEHARPQFDNVEDYVDGFLAALRTHRHLTGEEALEVETDPDGELPLAQRILLR